MQVGADKMGIRNFLLLLAAGFIVYKYFYRVPEESFGVYDGPSQVAPRLSGREVLGHLRVDLGGERYIGAHGFLLNANSRKLVVSASHVVVGSFSAVSGVAIMSGENALVEDAKPAVGISYNTCRSNDARRDVAFYTTNSGPVSGALSISDMPPKVGQSVWLLCTLDGAGQRKELIAATVTASTNRGLQYDFEKPVAFRGTSGCPVINSDKELVGVNVCGLSAGGLAVPIPTLVDSLEDI